MGNSPWTSEQSAFPYSVGTYYELYFVIRNYTPHIHDFAHIFLNCPYLW